MAEPIIEVADLVKRYRHGEANAVDGVSLTVGGGEFFALLGPNGAGKTTTISILTTTLAPTSGSVRVAGHDVVREASAVRGRVGIMFQQPSLDQNLTGEGNIRIHAVLYGLYPYRPTFATMPHAYKDQVHELAGLLGIEADLFRPVKRLSGGMKRKLEVVRSLMHQPQALFLDEPTAGLDTATRRGLWDYLRAMQAETGITVFLTTHYLEEAEQADRVCIIDHGKVVAYGSTAEIKAELAPASVLLDADDRQALAAELAGLGHPVDGRAPFTLPLDGPQVHALLRRLDTPLTLVRTHAPTLEDAYLAIVAREAAQP